jgi:enoyl-CoA hydratase
MAERIAGNGPLALRAIKRTATRSIGRSPAEGFELENAAKSEIFASDDAREGPRAFMEKRLPVYRGR